MEKPAKVFLTGRPGVGKTTVIERTLQMLGDIELHGFITREMRENGRRVGFRIDDLHGNGAVMAHVDFSGPPRVSKYGVDVDAVERVAVEALNRAVKAGTPAVIDEVGKMELASDAFAEKLIQVVEADIPVLGTMHKRRDRVTRQIHGSDDTRVIEVTTENRDGLPARLADLLVAAMD